MRIFLGTVSVLAVAATAAAGPLDDAKSAYVAGDYATAATLMVPLAAAGDAEAQLYLGFMYLNGRGVDRNAAEAARLHRQVAEKGYALAQYSLAVLYQNGDGVPQDFAQAALWYRAAADQGNALAQFALGVMYTNAHGVPRDDAEAYFWIKLAVLRYPPGDGRAYVARNLDAVREHLSAERLGELEARVAAWQPKEGPRLASP